MYICTKIRANILTYICVNVRTFVQFCSQFVNKLFANRKQIVYTPPPKTNNKTLINNILHLNIYNNVDYS